MNLYFLLTKDKLMMKVIVTIDQQFYLEMAYVEQVCEGYNKKSLMGNWFEERLYPQQPFRENKQKQARPKDEGITTFDGTGFQRALPRLERRTKWETTNRIVLDDGIKIPPTVMRAEYPHNQQQSSLSEMRKPYDKAFSQTKGTSIHPHSEVKPNQTNYHIMNRNNGEEIQNQRNILMYASDFKSTLPQHPPQQKFTNYVSEFKGRFTGNGQSEDASMRSRTMSGFNQSSRPAGQYQQVYPQQTVKAITTMFCENKKQNGDEKERTEVQRSWVPTRDKAISYSMGRTADDFKRGSVPRNDVQTSINMNIGVHNLHPKEIPENYFRHTRTVTVSNNKTLCSRP